MPKIYTYLLVDLGCILVPFLFSFHPKLKFVNQWRNFLLPCVLTALFFLIWDVLFTYLEIWTFNPKYIIGIYILGLPLEEILFFICIPYACVFTYHCIVLLTDNLLDAKVFTWIYRVMILGLVAVALFYPLKLYTSVTFVLLSIVLSFLLYAKKPFLGNFLVSFVTIIPFFLISNGILTGSFIDEPVVMYDNNYNLSMRIFTIPVEDVFYGMLLLLLNVSGFEYLKEGKREGSAVLS